MKKEITVYQEQVMLSKSDSIGRIKYFYSIVMITKGNDIIYHLLIKVDWKVMKDLSSADYGFLRNYAIWYIEWLHWMAKLIRDYIWPFY